MNKQLDGLGGAFFEYLFDGETKLLPVGRDEEIYFGYLKKRFSSPTDDEGSRHISITAEEIATTLKLAQAATLTKAELKKTPGVSTSVIASDSLLDEIYAILEENSSNTDLLKEIDTRLNAPQETDQTSS